MIERDMELSDGQTVTAGGIALQSALGLSQTLSVKALRKNEGAPIGRPCLSQG